MIFEPFQLNHLTLENRIVLPAMVTRLSGEDGHVNEDIRNRYVRFAKGEPGLIVVEAMAVHSAKSGPLLRIGSDEYLPGLRDLAKAVHDVSPSKVVPQIIHFLKISRSGYRQTIDELGTEDIAAIVEQYAVAATRARIAGFDGVELHMAHAYTLASFLSRLNPRRDAYGGSLENRLRLPTEVLVRTRRAVGSDFTIGVRFLGEECIKDGYTSHDAIHIAERLALAGADYLSLSVGGKFEDAIPRPGEPLYPYTGYSGERCMPGSNHPDGANLHIAETVRAHLRKAGIRTPVVATGKIGSLEMAEHAISREKADLVGMARALLADPDLPKKWRAGQEERVVRCLYGNVCKALDENFKRVVCTLWPKGSLDAPESNDTVAPTWPESGAELVASCASGRVVLKWKAALDDEGLYGYQVFRSEDGGRFVHYASLRARSTRFEDGRVVSGHRYRYFVRPYDLAGNRGPQSDIVDVDVPATIAPSEASSTVVRKRAVPVLGICSRGEVS